jgi:NitT/TauT family transport system substrate-binding protein
MAPLILGVLSACFLFASISATATGAERTLRFAYSAVDTSFLPAWVAKDAGFFDKNRVPLELISFRSSPLCISAHIADEIDICAGATSPVIAANVQGHRDLVLFGTLNRKAGFWIYGKPGITTVSGLRGKRFGVTRFGGALDFVSRFLLRQGGLDPVKDLTMVQIGTTPDIVLALAAQSIDAGTLSLPSNLRARELGFRELADFTEYKQNYPSTALSAKRKFLIENRSTMENFTKALIEALHYTRTNRQGAIKILSRYTRVADQKLLETAYDFHVDRIWPRTPEITPEDLNLLIEKMTQATPKSAGIDPSLLVHGATVMDVVQTGFADRLYRGQK